MLIYKDGKLQLWKWKYWEKKPKNYAIEPIFLNILLELDKDFIKLKDRELKDRNVKIKREIEELFFKPNVVSIDDMDNKKKWTK